jgi:hypothetical protein
MVKWEYRVETTEVGGTVQRNLDKMTNRWLNQFGDDGWELIAINTFNVGTGNTSKLASLVFKRPIE